MTVKRSATRRGRTGAGATSGARGTRQKRRTRAALLLAAGGLIARGESPSVGDVADAADVSRRTAYRYFPTQDQLLVEATLESLRPQVEAALAAALPGAASGLDDVAQARARLDAAVVVMHRLALANEPLLRTMIRLTAGKRRDGPPIRGYRRIDWLTSAIQPIRARLGRVRFERLLSALVACVGMDSLFLLHDARGLAPPAAERITRWTARALLDTSIRESEGKG